MFVLAATTACQTKIRDGSATTHPSLFVLIGFVCHKQLDF